MPQKAAMKVSHRSSPLAEQFEFLRGLIASPKGVGAIAPSSAALARAIAAQADPDRPGPVLELGPGTGVVTEALIARGFRADRITAIEYDPEFVRRVRERCPGVNVIQGDAFALDTTLKPEDTGFCAIISGIPLLNWPIERRKALIEGALARVQPGAPLIQFSYGLTPPMPATERFDVRRAAVIWANLPPARVWVYRSR
ncbi:MAG: methyltransferase domain-containing protein [Alphaproteobacteria bacterium]|nr:methyltransferase domain-containing protein [Alphaproteobacteria bacterium]